MPISQGHHDAAGLRNKPIPHYDDLAHVFRKDKATGFSAEGHSDMTQTVDREEAEENEDIYDTDNSLASTQDPPVATSLASTQGPPEAGSSDNHLVLQHQHQPGGRRERKVIQTDYFFILGGHFKKLYV